MAFRLKYNSPVILSYALLCSLVFFLDRFTGKELMPLFTLYNQTNFMNPLAIFRLVSHIAGHISLDHLLGNMTFVLLIGPIVEEKYGSGLTLIMLLTTAVITGILNILFFQTGLIGASGIVFMLIVLVSFTNVDNGQIPLTFILIAMLFVGKEILNGIWDDGISQFAHIMGGICGGVFGFTSKK
ncbi:MAG: rhomboid family intramembrane serine protease [Saprospiraceae bacterium]|nr:rhomboid family intramembrane serine protease [Saprospiraceae bacterium]